MGSVPGLLRYCMGRPRSMHLPGGYFWQRPSENSVHAKFSIAPARGRPGTQGESEITRGHYVSYVQTSGRGAYIRNTLLHRTGAKRRPRQSRRPSAAKSIIRAEIPKDPGPMGRKDNSTYL